MAITNVKETEKQSEKKNNEKNGAAIQTSTKLADYY